jgi:hypothetical protein
MGEMATLDASPSSDPDGDSLYYSWREFYGNPHHGLIPIGADSLSKLNLYFPSPGRYDFIVRVSDGDLMSAETRTISVYVPGRKGVVGYTPSDAIVRVPDARIRVHNSSVDANNNVNPVDIAISDSLGRYYLENVEPVNTQTGRTYHYRVERNGFTSSEVLQMTVRPDPGFEDDREDMPLGRGYMPTSISGYVRRTNGTPIENANVNIIPGLGGVVFGASTDPTGLFQISGVPRGSWIMQLQASGFQPEVRDVNIADSMPVLQYTMQELGGSASLTGTVYLTGTDRPVPNVKVSLGTGAEVFSDTAGRYAFNSIPAGQYVLTMTRTGFEPQRLPVVVVKPGANALDLALSFASRGPSVFGTVTDATSGRPVRLATVGVETTAGLLSRSDISDYTGHYQLRDVPTGMQIFRVRAPGYETRIFTNNVAASMVMNIQLTRSATWRPPTLPGPGRPEARVSQEFIYLNSLNQSATLNATPSTGANLRYIWRENPNNPVLRRLPSGSETMASIQVSGFSKPGIYVYELQVKSGDLISANTAAITVFAPGLAGNVHASPSDGVFGLNAATIRAYNNFTDANNWSINNIIDSKQTLDNPIGNFALDNLSPGSYWIVARAQTGSGYNQYGPVRRRVNYSSAARLSQINIPRDEFQLSGTITDAVTGTPLENVRVVVAPGSMSESFRTTTDATGAYRLSAVPRGSAQPVMLLKEGYNTAVTQVDIAGNTTANRTLTANDSGQLASLSGFITADYQGILLPVHYAEVIVASGLARTFTDGNGYYEIRNLPPGQYFGTVRKGGYISRGLADFGFVQLQAGENTVDRVLTFNEHGPVVRGTVVNEYQEPIEGVEITLLPPVGVFSTFAKSARGSALLAESRESGKRDADGPVTLSEPVPSQTDVGGVFQMVDVPHGEREVEIRLPDGRTFTRTLNIEGHMQVVWDTSYDDFSLWRTRNFSPQQLSSSSISGEYATPAGDELPNIFKYLFGYDPWLPAAMSDAMWLSGNGDVIGFGFRRASGVSDLSYTLETRTNLVYGAWSQAPVTPVVTGVLEPGVDAVEVEINTTNDPALFWRLNLER